ncbi:hypothetical protein [Heyndrickxia camelliae]|uniref:Uncharacterized protein n=1 Tax=Heyndrickxia camelliae TaxID=1707093 RepID=A0A2N3LEI6_9BACI|nr:hypothetical protein [Heyndrickxia camelliae]PKR83038.1 hypothetical protein CWO92_21095 [Heyndrickxia camelliae]
MNGKNYEKFKGIVTKTDSEISPKFEIDFNKLSELTNHHGEFLKKVKKYYELEKNRYQNIEVYISETMKGFGQGGDDIEIDIRICVVFYDDTHICLFGCHANHEKYPDILKSKRFITRRKPI